MKFNLLDNLVLLALDDNKGTFLKDSGTLTLGLSGAVILQLSYEERITIKNKKIEVINSKPTGNLTIDEYFNKIIHSKKSKSIKSWIEHFQFKMEKSRKAILSNLVKMDILVKKSKKILWVIPINTYPTINPKHENQLKQQLTNIILSNKKPSDYDLMLLGLIMACDLFKEIFGKEKAKDYKKKTKHLLDNTEMSIEINKIIKEINDEILTVLSVLMITTIVVSTS